MAPYHSQHDIMVFGAGECSEASSASAASSDSVPSGISSHVSEEMGRLFQDNVSDLNIGENEPLCMGTRPLCSFLLNQFAPRPRLSLRRAEPNLHFARIPY